MSGVRDLKKYDPNSGNDGSLSVHEFQNMIIDLGGARPMIDWDEGGLCHKKYLLRRKGSVIAEGNTVKECYYKYKGWRS